MSAPTTTPSSLSSETTRDWHTVARVVMPEGADEDTLPLYVDRGQRRIHEAVDGSELATEIAAQARDVIDRYSFRVSAGQRTSFATYFNAFPASYWHQWTVVKDVRLALRTEGAGTLMVYRSNASGRPLRVEMLPLEGELTTEVELDLKNFGDGGWYWFDIVAGEDDVILHSGEWQVDGAPVRPGTLSIGITTFNRPDYCLRTVKALAAATELRTRLDRVYLVDQGSKPVEDEPGWAEGAAELGETLEVIHQDNLGGSGGFSRGMYETATAGTSAYHLLLDDDVNIEPEGISRALTFAGYCRVPTLVGGHMFDLHNRSVLHAFGEEMKRWRWFWGSVDGMPQGLDLGLNPLRTVPALHRRADVDYNGWWMTLVPTDIIREIGLSLPVFIKWDDAEYGLRARAAGYPTVSLPGAAVWHVSWTDKDDTIDWQAYFHERNRIVTALLYSQYDRGGRLLRELAQTDLKFGISARYYAQALRLLAVRDVLAGPEHLHETIRTRLPQLRAMTADFSDSQFSAAPDAFPLVDKTQNKRHRRLPHQPTAKSALPFAIKTTLRHLRPPREVALARPEARITHQDSHYWVLSQYDSAVVTKADGTGASWLRRDPKIFREQMAQAAALRARLLGEWESLRDSYRRAHAQFTSFSAWEQTFGIEHRDLPPSASAPARTPALEDKDA